MWWTLFAILLIVWFLAWLVFEIAEVLVHLLLLGVVVVVLYKLVTSRRG